MLRLLAYRRAVFVSAAAAVTVTQTPKAKASIYPEPQMDLLLLETPSELEKRIGVARRAVTAKYLGARAQVQGVISRWITVEESVEKRIKSLIAPDEPLTPGILYVGVATLTGSVLARTRSLPTRLLLPPTLLILSFRQFLPKISSNVSSYLGSLEDTYFPGFAEKHEIAKAHSAMTWERLKDASASGRERARDGVQGAVGKLEEATGLKLAEAMGWGKGVARAVEDQAREAAAVTGEKATSAAIVVENKVGEVVAEAQKAVGETTATESRKD